MRKIMFGKILIALAIGWFIFGIFTPLNFNFVFLSAFAIGMVGFLLWLSGAVPKLSDTALDEIERHRHRVSPYNIYDIHDFYRLSSQKEAARQRKKKGNNSHL